MQYSFFRAVARLLVSAMTLFPVVAGCNAVAQAQSATTFGTSGSVRFFKGTDALTDKDNSIVSVKGTKISGRALMFGCSGEGKIRVAFLWSKYLIPTREDEYRVAYRFDATPAKDGMINAARARTNGYFDERNSREFTKQATGSQTVLLRITDAQDSETIDETFLLDGLSEALALLPCKP